MNLATQPSDEDMIQNIIQEMTNNPTGEKNKGRHQDD